MSTKQDYEFAAKAAGIDKFQTRDSGGGFYWNPLTDDGDALRLAVKLEIELHHGFDDGKIVMGAWFQETSGKPQRFEIERIEDDPYAATRRAVFRAAVEIGRSMP